MNQYPNSMEKLPLPVEQSRSVEVPQSRFAEEKPGTSVNPRLQATERFEVIPSSLEAARARKIGVIGKAIVDLRKDYSNAA